MKISFFGATEGVTGSNYLVETGGVKFLVDCGLFQGDREEREKNWEKLPYDPSEIDFIVVTHSHIDHIGRLPYLARMGFSGKIYSTEPTHEFAKIFLEDTTHLLKNEAENLGHEPLFENEDVSKAVGLFETTGYHQEVSVGEIGIEFLDAGHILGSAIVKLTIEGKTVIFSGDLGNPPVPLLRDTEFIDSADAVIMESTYGDRLHHPADQRKIELEKFIEEAAARKGTILMPSFAMERTQEVLYELSELFASGKLDSIPVYLDSPLAIKATEIYEKFPEYYDREATDLVKKHVDFFGFKELKFTETSQESMGLDRDMASKIIIAGSGMSNGGRIVHHEKIYLPIPSTMLLVVGFQVNGTLGRRLIEGEKEVKIDGKEIFVKAQIESIDSYSAHADQTKLVEWVAKITGGERKIILTHGEQKAKETLSGKIKEATNIDPLIPASGEVIEI
ncbi:MAG: MBL fold metallo-hydrolase [bacterium]